MGVGVDKARKNGHIAEIYNSRVCGNGKVSAEVDDPVLLDQNGHALEWHVGISVDQAPRADGYLLSK